MVSFDLLTGNIQGRGLGSKVKWVEPSLRVMIFAGGLMSMSSCIFNSDCLLGDFYPLEVP